MQEEIHKANVARVRGDLNTLQEEKLRLLEEASQAQGEAAVKPDAKGRTLADRIHGFCHNIVRKTQTVRIFKVCTCMDTAFDDRFCSGDQMRITQFFCYDLKTAFFYFCRFYIFQFYLHLIFPPLIVTPIPHTTRST